MTGTYLGVADAALNAAITHLRQRSYTHSGRTAAQESVLQHRVGALWETLERTRQLAYAAGRAGDAGDSSALPALLSSKSAVADTAVQVVNDAMGLMGGISYRDGNDMERHLRDVRAAPVMSPTTDLLRIWTGRVLLGQPLLGE
ncbi:acyl-CoA dehydrogenase family protein [Deinococcus malanensis]